MDNCIFCKIRDKIIPKDFDFEDENVMVFADIHPLRPIHLLIVPKKHIKDFLELEDDEILKSVRSAIQKMIIEKNLDKNGFRITVNGGGAQIIDHLHFHLTGPVRKTDKM